MYEAINAFIIVVLKDSVERVMHITTNVISSRGSSAYYYYQVPTAESC